MYIHLQFDFYILNGVVFVEFFRGSWSLGFGFDDRLNMSRPTTIGPLLLPKMDRNLFAKVI